MSRLLVLVIIICCVGALPVGWVRAGVLERAGTQPGHLTAGDVMDGWQRDPDTFRCYWRPKGGAWQQVGPWKVARQVATASDDTFEIAVKPADHGGGVRMNAVVTARTAVDQPFELIFGTSFEASAWQRMYFPGVPYLVVKPTDPILFRFQFPATGWIGDDERNKNETYPFGVLESATASVMWGSVEISRPALLMPNAVPGVGPAVAIRPESLEKGQKVELDFFLAGFDKSTTRFRDLLRWYMDSWVNNDPLTKGRLNYSKRPMPRPFPRGNLVNMPFNRPILTEAGKPAPYTRLWYDTWKMVDAGSSWFHTWHRADETYPTEGQWYGEINNRHQTSAEETKRRVEQAQKLGIAPMMYFRSGATEFGVSDDRPPYTKWIARNRDGQPMGITYDYSTPDPSRGYRYKAPPPLTESLGITEVCVILFDMGIDEARQWYIEQLQRALRFYKPGGIAFDTGWAGPFTIQYSPDAPDTSFRHAVVRMQSDVRQWIETEFPQMRIVSNEGYGSVSQLFSDAVMLEAYSHSMKSELDYEAGRALEAPVVSFDSYIPVTKSLKPLDPQATPFLRIRYRAGGLASEGPILSGVEGAFVPGFTLLDAKQIKADGTWQEQTIDLRTVKNVKPIKHLIVHVSAAKADATFDLAEIVLTTAPGAAPIVGDMSGHAFPTRIDNQWIHAWDELPSAMARPDSVPVTNIAREFSLAPGNEEGRSFARFMVGSSGKQMEWEFQPQRRLIAPLYLQAISSGAHIAGTIMKGFPEMLRFSAESIALPKVMETQAAFVNAPGANVAAWHTPGDAMVAVSNLSKTGGTLEVRLSEPLLKDLKSPVIRHINANGRVMEGSSPLKQITSTGVTLELGPGEGVLLTTRDIYRDLPKITD